MRLVLLFSLVLVFLASACSKSPKCWGDDKLKGTIGQSIDVDIDCWPNSNKVSGIVIKDTSDLRTVMLNVDGCNLPSIDFSQHSLIGYFVLGKCNARFIRRVEKSGEDYIYTIKVRECGFCSAVVFSYNWVLIPALASEEQVVFEVE